MLESISEGEKMFNHVSQEQICNVLQLSEQTAAVCVSEVTDVQGATCSGWRDVFVLASARTSEEKINKLGFISEQI